MKTTIKTICLLAFLNFAGQSQAQTKEETISWIKEKIEKYPIYDKNIVKSIDPCKITVEEYIVENGKEYLYLTSNIPTTPIAFQGKMMFFNKEVVEKIYQNLNSIEYSSNAAVFDPEKEPELDKRMLKALIHLNTFCSNKKETF
ncbi:hypothetical protein SAMN05421741_11619 [Paenimyroides ummariense]|uniref:Uncharacterized protein n=1 Tax=Paenimyroides ummariense TaxID=913024 RepID=A0A1I5DJ48_9FLAO|nr:hypothetical protein [Paenimyroides ummariense]SFN99233.1 hypothetical protein SAMN05421741_11619 [Paenimyroides ummariense]